MNLISKLNLRIGFTLFLLFFAPDSFSAVWHALHDGNLLEVAIVVAYLAGSYYWAAGAPSWIAKLGRFNFLAISEITFFVFMPSESPVLEKVGWMMFAGAKVMGTNVIFGNFLLVIYHNVRKKKFLVTSIGLVGIFASIINVQFFRKEIENSKRDEIFKKAQILGAQNLEAGLHFCAQLGPSTSSFRGLCYRNVNLAFGKASNDIFDCKFSANQGAIFGDCLSSHPKEKTLAELQSLCDQEKQGKDLEKCKMQLILYAGTLTDCNSLSEFKEWCIVEFKKSSH